MIDLRQYKLFLMKTLTDSETRNTLTREANDSYSHYRPKLILTSDDSVTFCPQKYSGN